MLSKAGWLRRIREDDVLACVQLRRIPDDAVELKLRSERGLGELLRDTVDHEGGNPQLSQVATVRTLPESISRTQASRWQQAAALPEEAFEQHIVRTRGRGEYLASCL